MMLQLGVLATKMRCSVCNADLINQPCHHQKGETYDGETCVWLIDSFEIKHVALVDDKRNNAS